MCEAPLQVQTESAAPTESAAAASATVAAPAVASAPRTEGQDPSFFFLIVLTP